VYTPCGSPTFTSDEAAIAHYRSRCSALQAQLAAAEQDILEFTESSKELQAELEGELERMDKAEKGMRRELEDARNEKEEWKVRLFCARGPKQLERAGLTAPFRRASTRPRSRTTPRPSRTCSES
jgi:predicted RNase H-like nuclease (RuvC/YqgF family)